MNEAVIRSEQGKEIYINNTSVVQLRIPVPKYPLPMYSSQHRKHKMEYTIDHRRCDGVNAERKKKVNKS